MDRTDSEDVTQHQPATGGPVPDDLQGTVNTHFDSTASYWDQVYLEDDLQGRIYRDRQAAVLTYIDAAGLQADARVLEIGCGAGHLTMQLAERRLRVDAVDASPAMVDLTSTRARENGFEGRVNVAVADVHTLPFGVEHFDLVVAVGVLPWLHSPAAAIREMARVLRGDGQLVLTADNGARLSSFTDPREMLARSPLRRLYHMVRNRRGVAMSRLDFPRRIDRLVLEGGMRTVERRTVGFGPLSFLARPIFSDRRGIEINDRLQRLADRKVPLLRWTGWHYVLRASKRRGNSS